MRSYAAAFLAAGFIALSGHGAAAQTTWTDVAIAFTFDETASYVACPSGIPSGDTCLEVTGSAQTATQFGKISIDRIAYFDASQFDPSAEPCIPVGTRGRFFTDQGSANISGSGSVCLTDGSASYTAILKFDDSSTPAFGAFGGGSVTVGSPTSAAGGPEAWSVHVYVPNK